MYFADHAPPAVFMLSTPASLRGRLPDRALRMVREWASMHRDELAANWGARQVPIVYTRVVDEILVQTDRRAYRRAVQILKHARAAAQAAGETDAFATSVARLREVHRRRPTFIATLDKAKLTDTLKRRPVQSRYRVGRSAAPSGASID